jgi:hypothetical protein
MVSSVDGLGLKLRDDPRLAVGKASTDRRPVSGTGSSRERFLDWRPLMPPADLLAGHGRLAQNPAILLEAIPGRPVDSLPHGPGPCKHSHAGGRQDRTMTAFKRAPELEHDLGELAALPGLEMVAGQIEPLITVLRAEQGRRQAGIEISRPAWKNLVFTGGPGHG